MVSDDTSGRQGASLLVAAWWLAVACAGLFVTVFSAEFLPTKAGLDTAIIRSLMDAPDLWNGWTYDGFVNTARFWSVVFNVVPQSFAPPAYFCLMVLITVRLLGAFDVDRIRYHLLAGAWIACSSLFLGGPNKELIALPVALWLCMATSPGARVLATLLFLAYAAFFRQYWAICYFYYACVLFATRMHLAGRPRLALCIVIAAYAAPFMLANALGLEPLTDTRMTVNAERVDSPDARSAFNNTFENTGFVTDFANAVVAWAYMNVPVALLTKTSPHYIFFAAFQIVSLWFFVAGFASFLRDSRRTGMPGAVYRRCGAFVVAYSLTQSIFEPDFGSFLRHEVVFMIPMLVMVFYRAHATRDRHLRPLDLRYDGNVSAYL